MIRQALLTTCPEFASRNESDILERILAEMAVAELIQSFGSGQYETIADLNKTEFLYNLWLVWINDRRVTVGSSSVCGVHQLFC